MMQFREDISKLYILGSSANEGTAFPASFTLAGNDYHSFNHFEFEKLRRGLVATVTCCACPRALYRERYGPSIFSALILGLP